MAAMGKRPNIVEFTSTESGDGGRQRERAMASDTSPTSPAPLEKKGPAFIH